MLDDIGDGADVSWAIYNGFLFNISIHDRNAGEIDVNFFKCDEEPRWGYYIVIDTVVDSYSCFLEEADLDVSLEDLLPQIENEGWIINSVDDFTDFPSEVPELIYFFEI